MKHDEATKNIMASNPTISEREAREVFDRLLSDVWDYITPELIDSELQIVRERKQLELAMSMLGEKVENQEE